MNKFREERRDLMNKRFTRETAKELARSENAHCNDEKLPLKEIDNFGDALAKAFTVIPVREKLVDTTMAFHHIGEKGHLSHLDAENNSGYEEFAHQSYEDTKNGGNIF